MHKEVSRRLSRLYYDFEINGADYRFYITSSRSESKAGCVWRLQILKGKVLRIAGVDIDESLARGFIEQERLLYSSPTNIRSILHHLYRLFQNFFEPYISPSRFVHELSEQFKRHELTTLAPSHIRRMSAMVLRIFRDLDSQHRVPHVLNLNNPIES